MLLSLNHRPDTLIYSANQVKIGHHRHMSEDSEKNWDLLYVRSGENAQLTTLRKDLSCEQEARALSLTMLSKSKFLEKACHGLAQQKVSSIKEDIKYGIKEGLNMLSEAHQVVMLLEYPNSIRIKHP